MAAPGFTSADNVNHAQGISIKGGGIIPLTAPMNLTFITALELPRQQRRTGGELPEDQLIKENRT